MEFGCMFLGPRPQLHEQYKDGSVPNPNPVHRTDTEVYEDILKGARLAEELGFESVWIAEHGFSEHSILSSPHSMLAAIAAQTERVKVATAVTIVPWYHPLRMAHDLATIDVISKGRLIVGVGRGYQKHEYDAYGLDMNEARERFVEGLDIAVKAWTHERFPAYEGDFYTIPEVMVLPKPVQKPHPPICMAITHSPDSLDIAVRNGWGLLSAGSTFFPTDPEVDENLWRLYRSRMLDSGVVPEEISISTTRDMYLAETDEEALEVMRPRLQWTSDIGAFLRRPLAAARGSVKGYEDYAPDHYIDPELSKIRKREGMGAVGSPGTVTKAIKELESKNVTRLICVVGAGGLPYEQYEASMRLFSEKVMPSFM